jgi:hypothetical protein
MVMTTRSGEGLERAKDQGNEKSGIRKEWTHCCDTDKGTVVRGEKKKENVAEIGGRVISANRQAPGSS